MRVMTVTLNPCVDRTFWFDDFSAPPKAVEQMSGGKGLNVARVLTALGDDCLAIAPVGGEVGAMLARLARTEGIRLLPVPIAGEVRYVDTHVREVDWAQRVFPGAGPEIDEAEKARIVRAVCERLANVDVLAICGSAGCARAAACVPELIEKAKRQGVRVLLDSNGAALALGAAALPDVLKPNQAELAQLLGREIAEGEEEGAALELTTRGIGRVLVSLGARGAMQVADGWCEFCPAPRVRAINPIGSGDCFVAGWLHAQLAGFSDRGALAIACAAGAANAAKWPAAKLTKAEIEALLGFAI